MSEEEESEFGLSKPPVNILFNPNTISKKDVWEVNIIRILEILVKILNESDKKDLRVAGIAALSSAMIHRMKVESIFALQKAAMEKKPVRQKMDVNINTIQMPFRHESTYPVTLDELLGVLENLIGTIANPRMSKRKMEFEPVEPPKLEEYFISIEKLIGRYEQLVLQKVQVNGWASFREIVANFEQVDVIRCFFALLFLARDEKVELEQNDDYEDIIVRIFKK